MSTVRRLSLHHILCVWLASPSLLRIASLDRLQPPVRIVTDAATQPVCIANLRRTEHQPPIRRRLTSSPVPRSDGGKRSEMTGRFLNRGALISNRCLYDETALPRHGQPFTTEKRRVPVIKFSITSTTTTNDETASKRLKTRRL